LPILGNFTEYDRNKGVEEMMPWPNASVAKSHDFDEQGNETHTDYRRIIKIVLAATITVSSASNTRATSWMNTPASARRRSCSKPYAKSSRQS